MSISSIRIANFRNLSEVEISPSTHGLNIICGNNGSGKTSLLEAVHYLSVGRSFRSSNSGRLVNHQSEKFSVFAQIMQQSQHLIPVGVERKTAGSARLRLHEKDVTSIAEIAALLPVRVINSQSHNIFEAGPVFRRKYLDWGLFYQSDLFLPLWRQFERVLKQRNKLLRDRCSKPELASWTLELVKHGLALDKLRKEYVVALAPEVTRIANQLLNVDSIEFHYEAGWNEQQDYAQVLEKCVGDDLRLGYTQFGPHRADLDITINQVSVKHFLSRGQQKLLICAMIIAQGMLLKAQVNKGLIYLVDDLPAELDESSRRKLIHLLSDQEAQVFVTAIEQDTICNAIQTNPVKVFHVEHGAVKGL